MKKILEFKINKVTKEKKEELVKNDLGEEIKREIEVIKKTPSLFYIKKPTRSMFDDAELYYGVKLGEGIRAGMITRAMLAKRFNNDGGVFSDPEMAEIKTKYKELFDATNDYQALTVKAEKTPEDEKKLEEAKINVVSLRREIQRVELERESLYERTADVRAKNKLLSWWTVNLCFEEVDGKDRPFFKGESIEDKLDDYEKITESTDEIKRLALRKFLYYISFWNSTGTVLKEDFEKALKNLEQASNEADGEYEDLIEDLKKEDV